MSGAGADAPPGERAPRVTTRTERRDEARSERACRGVRGGEAPRISIGAEGQNRTADTVIFSHVLYQLSYLGTEGAAERSPNADHINSMN
jgi:hypothetical protein